MTVTVSSPNRICDIGLLPHRDTHRAHKENIYGKASHTVSTKDTLYETKYYYDYEIRTTSQCIYGKG